MNEAKMKAALMAAKELKKFARAKMLEEMLAGDSPLEEKAAEAEDPAALEVKEESVSLDPEIADDDVEPYQVPKEKFASEEFFTPKKPEPDGPNSIRELMAKYSKEPVKKKNRG